MYDSMREGGGCSSSNGLAKLDAVSRNEGFSGAELSSPDSRDDEPWRDLGVLKRVGFCEDVLTEAIEAVS